MSALYDQENPQDDDSIGWHEECPVCEGSGIARMHSAIGDETGLFDCPACGGDGYRIAGDEP